MSVEKQKPLDPRIGRASKEGQPLIEPKLCAVSGQSVRGRHQEQRYLRDGFFYAVLNKFKGKKPAGLDAQMLALLPPEPEPESVPAGDAEKDAHASFSTGDTGEVLTNEEASSIPPAEVKPVASPPASKRVRK